MNEAANPTDINSVLGMFKDPEALRKFLKTASELNKQMENEDLTNEPLKIEQAAKRLERREKNEEQRKLKNLPIYAKREEIMKQIIENKFSIVVGDTGCGKSTQLPQYIFEHFEEKSDAKILWVLPRKLPTLSLSERVCDEMNIPLGQEIGYEIPNKNKSSSKTILKFMIDTVLINELVDKRAKAGPKGKIKLDYSMIVLDEVHERNLYTDILLATLKEIARDSNLKILITSATINEAVFENYFETKAIQVKGRPYPVELEYYAMNENGSPVTHMTYNIVQTIERIERNPNFQYKGHILVFTSGVDDIIKISSRLSEEEGINFDKYEVLPLHGLLTPVEQRAVFQDVGKIKIILSTRMAETALTIDGVRVVIDVGFDKETVYDPVKRMSITENKPIPQSSAIQRAGRAGRTSPGLCVRLYSEEAFEKLSRNKIPEIQRMDLGKVILKLKAMGVGNLREFAFVERPKEETLVETISHLVELGALNKEDETLTNIGKAMLKLETDPDFSKAILEGLQRNCAQEVIEIIAMIGASRRLYSRGFEDETMEAADRKKFDFCHEKGDLLTLLKIYKSFKEVNPDRADRGNKTDKEMKLIKDKCQKWCKSNYLSFPALNEASYTVRGLKKGLEDVKIILKIRNAPNRRAQPEENKGNEDAGDDEMHNRELEEASLLEDSIIKCFLSAFYQNICLYTNIPRVGYTLLRDNLTIKPYGSSSISLQQEYPKYIFCLDVNKTTYNHCKIASLIKQEWLEELFPGYKTNPNLEYLTKSYTFMPCTFARLGRPILGYFAYKKTPEIKAISESRESTFYIDWKEEKLQVYSAIPNFEELVEKLQDLIDEVRLVLFLFI